MVIIILSICFQLLFVFFQILCIIAWRLAGDGEEGTLEGAEGVEAAAVGEEQDRMSTVAVMRYRSYFMKHTYYHYKIKAFSAKKVAAGARNLPFRGKCRHDGSD